MMGAKKCPVDDGTAITDDLKMFSYFIDVAKVRKHLLDKERVREAIRENYREYSLQMDALIKQGLTGFNLVKAMRDQFKKQFEKLEKELGL